VVVDVLALHLDLERWLGRAGRFLNLLHQVLVPVGPQDLTRPPVADTDEDRAAGGVGEGNHRRLHPGGPLDLLLELDRHRLLVPEP
jgi:hypothetical protein